MTKTVLIAIGAATFFMGLHLGLDHDLITPGFLLGLGGFVLVGLIVSSEGL